MLESFRVLNSCQVSYLILSYLLTTLKAFYNLLAHYAGMIVIIAPIHIERRKNIISTLRSYNLNYRLRSS